MTLPRLSFALGALALLTACADPPAVADAETAAMASTPPPPLLPIDQILARTQAARIDDASAAALSARGAALRARAAAIAADQPRVASPGTNG